MMGSPSYYFDQQFVAAGVPDWISHFVQDFEGNVRPDQVTPDSGGTLSVGSLQLNTGGQASGLDPYWLASHPDEQAAIGIPPIAAAYKAGVAQGLDGLDLLIYTMANSGHPTETGALPGYAMDRVQQLWQAQGGMPTPSPTPVPRTPAAGAPGPAGPTLGERFAAWWQERVGMGRAELGLSPHPNAPTTGSGSAGGPASGGLWETLTTAETAPGLLNAPRRLGVMIVLAVVGLILIAGGVWAVLSGTGTDTAILAAAVPEAAPVLAAAKEGGAGG